MDPKDRRALPPDPNPRPPHFDMPAGACDSHFHIFGLPHVFPFAGTRRYTPTPAPLEHYLMMQDAVGLSRGVVVQPTAHGVDNSVTLDAIRRGRGRLKGVANIDATVDDETLDQLKAGGICGARFNLMSDRTGSTEDIVRELPRLERLGWSLDLHLDIAHLVAHADFIRALPVTVVIDHMARPDPAAGIDQPDMAILLELIAERKFWVKLSGADKMSAERRAHVEDGLPYMDVVPFARAIIEAIPDRVIWGSDWPHSNIFTPGHIANDGDMLDLLAEYAPDETVRNRILVDNPARLYGFGD